MISVVEWSKDREEGETEQEPYTVRRCLVSRYWNHFPSQKHIYSVFVAFFRCSSCSGATQIGICLSRTEYTSHVASDENMSRERVREREKRVEK